MMRLLYGTTNPGKLQSMKKRLAGLDVDIIGLDEALINVRGIKESGSNPMENARIKALAYYKASGVPVFSCDSGLFIEGLNDEEQPGVYVRRVNGRELDDEEMIEYYSNLAIRLGGKAKAAYRNAICLVFNEEAVYEYDGEDISSESFIITSEAHPKRIPGFPLDSLSIELETGKYYMDTLEFKSSEGNDNLDIGFRNFFIRTFMEFGVKLKENLNE